MVLIYWIIIVMNWVLIAYLIVLTNNVVRMVVGESVEIVIKMNYVMMVNVKPIFYKICVVVFRLKVVVMVMN